MTAANETRTVDRDADSGDVDTTARCAWPQTSGARPMRAAGDEA